MRRLPRCSLVCQRPLTLLILHHPRPPLLAHSLYKNGIGAQGASALAAVLKETRIAELKYASTSNRRLSVRLFVSAR